MTTAMRAAGGRQLGCEVVGTPRRPWRSFYMFGERLRKIGSYLSGISANGAKSIGNVFQNKNGIGKARLTIAIIVCLIAWTALFSAGILVNSQPYRQSIKDAVVVKDWDDFSWNYTTYIALSWIVVVTCYTPTNIAILCSVAGLLGTLGDHVKLGADSQGRDPSDRTHPFISSLVRSFFVYIVLISGVFILAADPFPDPTLEGSSITYTESALRELYIRLAGIVSLASFAVSYDPMLFTTTLLKIANLTEPNKR